MSKKINNKLKIGDGNSIKNSSLGVSFNSKGKKGYWGKSLFLGVVASIVAAVLIAIWNKYTGN